jgi:transposase
MDGNLEEWTAQSGVAVPHVVAREDGEDAPPSLEATWWLAWDDNFLYLAAAVADDVHVQTQPPRLSYRGDSLEVQLDTDLEGDRGTLLNGDDYQYLLSPGDLAGRAPAVFRFRGTADHTMADAPATGARITAVPTGYGYNVEAAIPWRDLDLTPTPGLTLGAALSVNDNDTPETAVQEMMLSHVSSRRWRDPGTWGTLILEP